MAPQLYAVSPASICYYICMQGLLLVDKPSGWTSFDVVNYLRKIVAQAENKKPKQIKVGHTGTLDPLATGLLVILIGKGYTRQAQVLSKHDKTYEVTMRLGQTSSTGDEEGSKTPVSDRQPTAAEIRAVLEKFTGDLMQTPPAYSAIKINGQRAYQLARAGQEVELKARPVRIDHNELKAYVYPDVSFSCDVSSGTYIRSLVADMGVALGTGAYLAALRRTRVGEYQLADAISGLSREQPLTADQIEQSLKA